MKVGISTCVDYSVPLDTALNKIRASGFDAVAIGHLLEHFPHYDHKRRSEIRALLDSLALPVECIHAPIAPFFDLASDDDHVRASTTAIYRATIDSCHALGAPYMVLHATAWKLEPGEVERCAMNAIPPLRELVEFGGTRNVRVAIENMPPGSGAQAVTELILEEYPGTDLRVCYDTSHDNIGGRPLRFFEKWSSRVAVLHVSDNRGESDEHIIPMKGTFPWERFILELSKSGYSGILMLENEVHPGDDFDGYLAESYAAADKLRSMWNATTQKAAASS